MRRFYFTSMIGDGGEFHAVAYPEDICDDDEEPKETYHGFALWIEHAGSSIEALQVGTQLAREYFARTEVKQ